MTDDLDRVLADIDTLLPPGAPSNPAYDGIGEAWEAEAMRWSPVDHDTHPDVPAPPEPGDDDYVAGWQVAFAGGGWVAPSAGVYDLARDWPSQVPLAQRRPVGEPDREGLMQQRTGLWPAIWQTTPTPLPPADEPHRPNPAGVVIERAGWHLLTWPGLESVFRAAADYQSQAVRDAMLSLIDQAQHTTSNLQHLRDRADQAQQVIDARRHRNTGPANPRGIDGRARRHKHPTRAPAPHAQAATQGSATPVIVRRPDGTLLVSFDPAWQ